MIEHRKLGELLIERELISEEQLNESLELQKQQGGRIGSILVKLGFLEEETLLNFLSLYFGIPQIDLRNHQIQEKALQSLPLDKAREHLALPVKLLENLQGEKLIMVAMADPTNSEAIKNIQEISDRKVDPYIASYGSLTEAINRHYEESAPVQEIDLSMYEPDQVVKAITQLFATKSIISATDLKDTLEKDD